MLTNKEIFDQSTIKKVDNARFGNAEIQCGHSGFALYHPEYGFMGFGDKNKYGIEYPYIPSGGRKALRAVKDGGLMDYACINWIKPFQVL